MPSSPAHIDKQTIRDEFNEVAPEYESNRLAPWYKAHADVIVSEIACDLADDANTQNSAITVADIGCGTGYLLRKLISKVPNSTGYGIDIAENMAKTAKAYAQDAKLNKLHFINDDWETMPLESLRSAPVDVLVCANAFHYFSDPQAACNKMAACLDKGQLYLLERDNSRSLLTAIWAILHRTIIKDHVVFYDQQTLFTMLEKAGFTDIKTTKHLKRYFWKGKLFTNVILISCKKI